MSFDVEKYSKTVNRDIKIKKYDVSGLDSVERKRNSVVVKQMKQRKENIIISISRRKYKQYVCEKCKLCTSEQLSVHNNVECVEFDHTKSKFVDLSVLHKMMFEELNVHTRLMLIALEISEYYRGVWLCANHHFEKTMQQERTVARSDVFGGLLVDEDEKNLSSVFTQKEVKTLVDEIRRKAKELDVEPLKYYFEIMKKQRERPDLSITTTETRKTTRTLSSTTTVMKTTTTMKTTKLASAQHVQQEIIPDHVTIDQLVTKCHERLKKMHEFETCAREMAEKILSGTGKYFFAEFDAKKAYDIAKKSSGVAQVEKEELRKEYEMSKRFRHYCTPIRFDGEKVQYIANIPREDVIISSDTILQRCKKLPSLEATQRAGVLSSIMFTVEKEIDSEQPTVEWKKFRQMRREWAIRQLGGKCVQCGCVSALEFNHVRGEKNGNMSTLFASKTLDVVKEELTKCQLFCKNCHHIFTDLQQRKMIECPVELKKFHDEQNLFSSAKRRRSEEVVYCTKKRLKASSLPKSMFYRKEKDVETTDIENGAKKNDNGQYSCFEQDCTFCSDNLSHMLRHVRNHTKEKPWLCPIEKCARSFKRSDQVRSHLRHFHKDKEIAVVEHRDENNVFCKYEIDFE